jgi:hypothetical protein
MRGIRNPSSILTVHDRGDALTDCVPGQRAFYEALGFTEEADFSAEPLRVSAPYRAAAG